MVVRLVAWRAETWVVQTVELMVETMVASWAAQMVDH